MLEGWRTIQAATLDAHQLFVDSASNLQGTQSELLLDILARNVCCVYGKQYNFKHIENTSQFQAALPIIGYDDIEDLIDLQCKGQKTLCSDPVVFYEKTGGSSSACKRIPYTDASLHALQLAINPWLYSLIDQRPGMTKGRSYWSISPMGRVPATTPDGTQLGAPSDLDFLSESIQAAFVDLLAVPLQVAGITDINEWRYHTIFALIADPDLTLLSVWSPGFLTLLLESIPGFADRLYLDLTGPIDQCSLDESFRHLLQSQRDKQAMLARIKAATKNDKLNVQLLWPALDTISCWTHGSARHSLPSLEHHFPKQHLQAKGLLATEAIVSIPLSGSDYPVLAVNSAFFEFVEANGKVKLAHELEIGCTYEVLVTTYGGLYRYALGDKVRVCGHYHQLPALEFIGRSGSTSDLCGEKLNDAFVAECLKDVPGFSFLTPIQALSKPEHFGYCLFIEASENRVNEAKILCHKVEKALQSNPQYEYARRLEQLQPLTYTRVHSLEACYVDFCNKDGQVLGDIKPVALCINKELIEYLYSSIVEQTGKTVT